MRKRKSKLFRLLTSKFLLVCFLLLLELAFIPVSILILSAWVPHASTILNVVFFFVDIIVAIYIVNSDVNAEYKIAWLVPVLAIPPAGAVLYLLLRRHKMPRRRRRMLSDTFRGAECLYAKPGEKPVSLSQADGFANRCAEYVTSFTGMPFSDCTDFEYFPMGQDYGKALLDELEKAEKYIFLEYFVIQPGKFFNAITDILVKKANAGVDVRLIYDDIGSMLKVPGNFAEQMEKKGVKCMCFNPFRPVLDIAQNNRTHRKIAVIDGKVAFTGGVNLADEYINETHPFGTWKDTGILVRGRVVQNFTAMFLQLWTLRGEEEDYTKYLSDSPAGNILCTAFSDAPRAEEGNVCENLYLKIIYNAKKYVYINTPYLILDGEMKRALINAAQSGVDVRITVPNIPDKKYVFAVTKAFYSELVKEGIKVYRYTPGFLHAKSIVSDDSVCIIGSTNMDFRSFYMHFECDLLFFSGKVCAALYHDYLETCEQSHLVTENEIKDKLHSLIYRSILRFFAPMM
ncbi:MAG TPA: cardiolipin synthase [Candidatus Borkfalkia faecipullorum]|uniref:Cardiolipin synthase n=1 Tax=Candidatus Borkfalkia faecipullorum TaxID=2838510 RepID=A0A9D1V7P0_9FIRM|nr:cardiolipin synthase [Candidatus Borkfalkia faecipullorum]